MTKILLKERNYKVSQLIVFPSFLSLCGLQDSMLNREQHQSTSETIHNEHNASCSGACSIVLAFTQYLKKKKKHQKGLDRAIANVSSTLKHVSSQQAAHKII